MRQNVAVNGTAVDLKENVLDRPNQTPPPATPTPTNPSDLRPPAMDVEKDPGADMEALLQRLRLHRAAPSPYDTSPAVTPAPAAAAGSELLRPRRAAVLVCLFRGARGELRVILTKRASTLSTHSGEVALPGGKTEEGDADDAATALRESKEEIGLDPALVTVAASLEHFLSKDENRTSEEREKMGQTFTVHYFTYEKGDRKYIIWGLTARILIHAASVVYERPPAFPEQRVQFNLAKYQNEYSSVPLGSIPARH